MRSEFDGVPDDVLEELREAARELEGRRLGSRRVKRSYPSSRDIVEAVRDAALSATTVNPLDFPDMVRERLEARGFYAGLVTDRRIWRVYEDLVRRGVIPDTLGVVE